MEITETEEFVWAELPCMVRKIDRQKFSIEIKEFEAMFPYHTGYVGIPKNHPDYKLEWHDLDEHLTVHGGVTYAGVYPGKEYNEILSGLYWIGFDTNHFSDDVVTKSKEYVIEKTKDLAEQLARRMASDVRTN